MSIDVRVRPLEFYSWLTVQGKLSLLRENSLVQLVLKKTNGDLFFVCPTGGFPNFLSKAKLLSYCQSTYPLLSLCSDGSFELRFSVRGFGGMWQEEELRRRAALVGSRDYSISDDQVRGKIIEAVPSGTYRKVVVSSEGYEFPEAPSRGTIPSRHIRLYLGGAEALWNFKDFVNRLVKCISKSTGVTMNFNEIESHFLQSGVHEEAVKAAYRSQGSIHIFISADLTLIHTYIEEPGCVLL